MPRSLADYSARERERAVLGNAAKCKACCAATTRLWYSNNRARAVASALKRQREHPEQHRERCRRSYAKNRVRLLAAAR